MTRVSRTTAVVASAVLALGLAGCGEYPDDDTAAGDTPASSSAPPAPSIDFKACLAADSGGFADNALNQLSLDGLLAAQEGLGVEVGQLESDSDAAYLDSLNALVTQGCNAIAAVGSGMAEATEKAARVNPEVEFSIVDVAYDAPRDNLKGLAFAAGEPAFLAGYLAAAQSESGVVGTFGGDEVPEVMAVMEGFRLGVERFNSDNGGSVKLIGWDGTNGSFLVDVDDAATGRAVAEDLLEQDADVVLAVPGPTRLAGPAGLQAVQEAGRRGIWVGTDGCEALADLCDSLLTSVVKRADLAVEEAVKASVEETFSNEPYVGTLANGGVELAPYFEDDVSDEVRSQLEALRAQIVDGSLTVG